MASPTRTCGTCGFSWTYEGQPGGIYCIVDPPKGPCVVPSYIAPGEAQIQTVFADPPVRENRPACRHWEAKGKKK